MSLEKKEYGSGLFGNWIIDEFGLPAYSYTLDQTELDPGISYLTSKEVEDKSKIKFSKTVKRRRNWHMIGNDNTIALAVNNNTVQVFSGERGAKYLNEYAPALKGYSGGFGFIKDGSSKWAMIYSPKTEVNYKDRLFGMGYFKKSAEYNDLEVIETIFTPYGKHSVFLIEVKLINKSNSIKKIDYHHYWDVLFTSLGQGGNVYGNKGRWSGFFLNIQPFEDGKGLFAVHKYKRWWHPRPSREEANPVDFYPPVVFLKTLDEEKINSFETKKKRFFNKKSNVDEGSGLNWNEELSSESLIKSRGGKQEGLMMLKKSIEIKPGVNRVLRFVYGYIFTKSSDKENIQIQNQINDYITKYNHDYQSLLKVSSESWKDYCFKFSGSFDNFISREQAWHSYYLRAGANYNEYFDSYTIQQGGVYTYVGGQNIALRDPVQHALPMVYLYPELAREVLLYILKCVKEDGEIPYGITGNGFWTRMIFYPSDGELYLFNLMIEYILATRDFGILEERVPFYPKNSGKDSTVKERLVQSFEHLVNDIGIGTHQLIRMLQGDWNDMVVLSDSWRYIFSTIQYGESTLNTAIASYVLDKLAQLFSILSDEDKIFAISIQKFRNILVEALKKEFNGRWFNRGYNGNGNILGKEELYVSLQPWTILGNVINGEEKKTLVENIYQILSKPSDIGAICYWGPNERSYLKLEPKGTATNGGIWYSLNMPLIWAYSKVNREYAWEEYKHIHLANRAEKYPGIWEAILSCADTYNSFLAEKDPLNKNKPGKSMPMMDPFPVMIMHSCACPIFASIRLAGIEVEKDGLKISPKIINYGDFDMKTELVELGKVKNRIYGKYKNKFSESGTISISLDLPSFFKVFQKKKVNQESLLLSINGKEIKDFEYQTDSAIIKFPLSFSKKGEMFEWNLVITGGAD